MQQDQQYCTGLSQLRSAAENGNGTLLAEIRRLRRGPSGPRHREGVVSVNDQSSGVPDSSKITNYTGLETAKTDGNAVSMQQYNSVPNLSIKDKSERVYRYSIDFTWLTARTWQLVAFQSRIGWQISLKIWSRRPKDSRIFFACRLGSISTVQELLMTGEASPFDYYAESHNAVSNIWVISLA